ncbi:MAG: gluconate 2-dehydrogenase subunit 3 family protein [Pedobacter sp.]|nr:MAG: gluconate 2-dehydrogenase subunit 3 family protein [Pedobacter sp.]
MDRRDAVKSVAFLLGGALSATTIGVFLEGCHSSSPASADLFSADQEKMLAELADIIIPATKTPGAKAAGVGPFISMIMKECYPEDAQKVFTKGLEDLQDRAKKDYSKSFLDITPAQRQELVGKVREETIAAQKADKESDAKAETAKEQEIQKKGEKENNAGNPLAAKVSKSKPYFFAIARDLTLLGYFTSEIGATQAYEYLHIPGHYDGCVDLKPGQRVWATN